MTGTQPLTPARAMAPAFAALVLALLSGCAAREPAPDPPVDLSQPFSRSGGETAPDRWWRAFGDDELNALVDRALRANLDLKSAWQRLRAARAVAERESAGLFPSLDATAEASTESGSASDATFESRSEVRAGFTAQYEVDLWGRIRAGTEAERLRARATRADYRTAALSLAAEVARTWYRLAEARSRLALINEQVATNRKVLELIRTRFGSGQVRGPDLLRQRRLLESVREQRFAAEARVRTLGHQLAVLLGRPPQEGVEAAPRALPALPPLPDPGVPAELVQRRPDVRGAFLRLRAADRDTAAAVSSQFPRITLSASALTTNRGAAELYDDWAFSFAAGLVAPLIDAGRRDAEVERTRAVERQRLHEYGQAVLTAFREVEDALVQERKQRQGIGSLRRQVRMAAESYHQLRQQYLGGMTGYLDVLTALSDLQALRRDLLAAHLDLVETRIGLYRALAGGFETRREAGSGMARRTPADSASRDQAR